MSEKRIIEINGIKLEVDLSTARRIDEFKIGDNVKVLKKCNASYEVYAGVIVEFVNFKERPTIIIAIFKNDYFGVKLEFIHYNSSIEDIEMVACGEHELKLEKSRVIDKFNNEIERKKAELDEMTAKRDYFLKHFSKYFEV
jgi:ribosomal protein L19